MMNGRQTVDDSTNQMEGATCDADDRVAAAAAAVAALGRFYSIQKQQQQQQQQQQHHHHHMINHQQHQQQQAEKNKSPTFYQLRSPSLFRSPTADYSGGNDGALRMTYRGGNYFSMATADFAIDDPAMFPNDCFSPLEKRPPVEGRDSMTGDNVADLAAMVCAGKGGRMSPTMSTSTSATLTDEGGPPGCETDTVQCGADGVCSAKAARYIPPSVCPFAERRKLVQHKTISGQIDHQCGQFDRAGPYSVRGRFAGNYLHRSSSLSSLSDIVAAAGDSDMLEFDDDEYDDYYRAADSAAALGRLKPATSFGGDDTAASATSRDASRDGFRSGIGADIVAGLGVSSRCEEVTLDT